jgi:hypothetical protein
MFNRLNVHYFNGLFRRFQDSTAIGSTTRRSATIGIPLRRPSSVVGVV